MACREGTNLLELRQDYVVSIGGSCENLHQAVTCVQPVRDHLRPGIRLHISGKTKFWTNRRLGVSQLFPDLRNCLQVERSFHNKVRIGELVTTASSSLCPQEEAPCRKQA